MLNLLQSLARASLNRSARLAIAAVFAVAALAFAPAGARADEVTFRDQTIEYAGAAEVKTWGEIGSGMEELVLIYTNADPNVVKYFKPSRDVDVRILAVGGGGGGGTIKNQTTYGQYGAGGGGGAGELIALDRVRINANAKYAISVGAGGAGATAVTSAKSGTAGGATAMTNETTGAEIFLLNGGGGGGGQATGKAGGSGGGGSFSSSAKAGGASEKHEADGKGNPGGQGTNKLYGAGGGGAGSEGGPGVTGTAGAGGAGYASDIAIAKDTPKESWLWYAGGGGGGVNVGNKSSGAGGSGVGGNGGTYENKDDAAPTRGKDGTGSGGGGGQRYRAGASGGCGVVIIRVTYIEIPITWQEIPVTVGENTGTIFIDERASYKWVNGGQDLVLTFTNVNFRGALRLGTEDVPIWANGRILAVGGGGGGGLVNIRDNGGGAGGGAGGFVEKSGFVFDNTKDFSIEVGRGGKAGAGNGAVIKEPGEQGDESFVLWGTNRLAEAAGGGGGGAESAGGGGASGGGGSYGNGSIPEWGWERPGGSGIDGQGSSGGKGGVVYRGGGGGGAGGAGGDATSPTSPGIGGQGKPCDITGEEKWYAAGGGGTYVNSTESTRAKQMGGRGGGNADGTIIVGGNGAGADGGATGYELHPIPATSGKDGTGSGGGGGVSYEGATNEDGTPETAGKGGDGIVIIRLSGFVVKSIPVPGEWDEVTGKYWGPTTNVYDGTWHVGVEPFFAYTFETNANDRTTWPEGRDADNYVVTVNLASGSPYIWGDWEEGMPEEKKWGERKIYWCIKPLEVAVPTVNATPPRADYFTFGNAARNAAEEKLAIDGDLWRYDETTRKCAVTNAAGTRLDYCTLAGEKATNASNRTFTATLVADYTKTRHVTNFVWKVAPPDGMATNDWSVAWTIAQAENEITALSLDAWQEGQTLADLPEPASAWQWQDVTAGPEYSPNPDVVKYQWQLDGTSGWTPTEPDVWANVVADIATRPVTAGVYTIRASICRDSKHEPGNWRAAERTARFYIWRHPTQMLANYVDITPSGASVTSSDSALTDFPVLVRLREPRRDDYGGITAGIPGFRYIDVNGSGSELRFLSIDAGGDSLKDELLPFEVETWNPEGESLVWVKVPKMWKGAKFRMYWRRLPGERVIEAHLPSETWNDGYVGVWHMNLSLANATALGSALDATGRVSYVRAKVGNAAKATVGSLVVPDYTPYLTTATKFSFSTFCRADGYASGGRTFIGTKRAYNDAKGWCWYHDKKTRANFYADGSSGLGWFESLPDVSQNFNHFGLVVSGAASEAVYYNYVGSTAGSSAKQSNTKTLSPSGLDLQVLTGYVVDEMRLSRTNRSDTWMRAEYESVNKPDYCTFGLVNVLEDDGETRSWVNYWLPGYGPWATASSELSPSGADKGHYWYEGELEATTLTNDFYLGKLADGKPLGIYTLMPDEVEKPFPVEVGPYRVLVTLLTPDSTSGDYQGHQTLFDGDRELDIEILKKLDPQPIDPSGRGGFDAVNARVLLGNDDLRADAAQAVTNQSFWLWQDEDTTVPPEGMPNLQPGTRHQQVSSTGDKFWRADNVWLGNIMTGDDAAEKPFAASGWHTLPWSATARNTRVREDYTNALKRSQVGTFVLRNIGGHVGDSEGARLVSPVYTNGVGTLYFDAVNAFNTTSTNYQLIVEKTAMVDEPNPDNASWERVGGLISLVYANSAFANPTTNDVVTLEANGGATTGEKAGRDRFTRVIARVNERAPVRVRIRRYGSAEDQPPDAPKFFIVVDNVIASWPTEDVQLRSRGWYDPDKKGKQVLGMETAFSIAFPKAGETNLFGYAHLDEGLSPENVASARFHYRWRYLDAMFDPPKQLLNGELQDAYHVLYLNKLQGYRTIAPLELNGLPGDIEYWFDLTANAPYYGYVDYSGLSLTSPVGGYTEEPAKGVTSRRTEATAQASHGSDWFVRLREGESALESVTVEIQGEQGEDGSEGFEPQTVELELIGDHLWRGFAKTLTRPPSGLLSYRVVTREPESSGSVVEDLDERIYTGNADLLTAKSVPGTVGLEPSLTKLAKVWCDAATGHLMFRLNDATMSLEICRADEQTFDEWSSSWRAPGDLKYFTSASETNSVSDTKARYPAKGEPSPVWGFAETLAVRPAWHEAFSVGGGQSAAGYRLNEPFATAKTPNGNWTANQGMWVPEIYGLTNRTSFALQLEGRGKGSLEFVNSSGVPAPNGLDTLSFTARLAQFIDFNAISYCYDDYRLTNYTFLTQAAFDTDKAFGGFSGAGSVSLIAGYVPKKGCYEFRVTMVNADPDIPEPNKGEGKLRFEFYRWNVVGNRMQSTLLYSTEGGNDKNWSWDMGSKQSMAQMMPLGVKYSYDDAEPPRYSGFFLSYRSTPSGVVLVGGASDGGQWRRSDDPEEEYHEGKLPLAECPEYSDCHFNYIVFRDTTPGPLTKGTYGVMANDCPAVFLNPCLYTNSVDKSGSTEGYHSSGMICFSNECGTAFSEKLNLDEDWWAMEPGRMMPAEDPVHGGYCGLMSDTNAVQTLNVYARKSGTNNAWTNIYPVTVSSFAATDCAKSLRTPQRNDIRFVTGGDPDDPTRLDVVVDEVAMSQWCGDDGSKTNAVSEYGYRYDYYYTSSWVCETVVTNSGSVRLDDGSWEWQRIVTTNRFVRMAPRRAQSAAYPISIRTPYLKGLGSLSFSYRNAQPGAKLELQKRRCAYDGGDGHLTDAPNDYVNWEKVETFDLGASGSGLDVTYHLGERYANGRGGFFRLVMPYETVTNALSEAGKAAGDDWGSFELTDLCCYDEPAYDVRSWWGWNFLTTGWSTNGVPSSHANLYDGPGGSVAALNNTLAADTLVDGDPAMYEFVDPFVQTPTFTNGVVGEVSFRARVFDPERQLETSPPAPSCLTIWGARDGALQNSNDWTAVTNILVDSRVYRTYTVKLGDSMRFAAVRVGVTGVEGIVGPMAPAAGAAVPSPAQRVLVDDFIVCERGKPEMRFRLNYVRPFRLGLTDLTAVPDIASRDQQPLLNEEFGFQAELDMSSTSSEIDYSRTPEVTVSYYPSDEPWGYDRWRTNSAAVVDVPLTPAAGTNYVYRSTSAQARAFCQPQQRLPDQPYGLVQYCMNVTYWDLSGEAHTVALGEDDWQMPSWYAGFPDPNAASASFSPFTLLDVVSPGRAWFNEINFSNGDGKTEGRQFIELCVPAGFDLTGWQIYGYDYYGDMRVFGSLGDGILPESKDTANKREGFDFLAVKSPKSSVPEADSSWRGTAGELAENDSYGFQLVRPSGVIEEQVVVQGNLGTSVWSRNKLGTNMVAELSRTVGGNWTFVAADTNALMKSAGVVRNTGMAMSEWRDDMDQTPGAVNQGQTIPPGWFLPPTGTNVWIMLTALDRHIAILDGTNEVDALTVVVPMGRSTNLVFRAAPWYQLGKLLRNSALDVTAEAVRSGREWRYAAVEGAANRLSLDVSSAVDQGVFDRGGIAPNDPYLPAVMNWLSKGVTGGPDGSGLPFEGDSIVGAPCRNAADGNFITNLTVKEMYWLDIDPTSGKWEFWQGLGELAGNRSTTPVACEKVRPATAAWPETNTNRLYTATMMITNVAARTEDYPRGGIAYAPYRLQGLANERSDDRATYPNGWTSVTAKVKMALVKRAGSGGQDVSDRFMTMRTFVFGPGSFGASPGHPFAARIEILDPYSKSSPGYGYGWHAYPGSTFLFTGSLDTAALPLAPSVLKSNDTQDQEWTD